MKNKLANLNKISDKVTREVCLGTVVDSPMATSQYEMACNWEIANPWLTYIDETLTKIEEQGNTDLKGLLEQQSELRKDFLVEQTYFLAGACLTYNAIAIGFGEDIPIIDQADIDHYFGEVCGPQTLGQRMNFDGEWGKYTADNDPLGMKLLMQAQANQDEYLLPAFYIVKDKNPQKKAAYDGNGLVVRLMQTALSDIEPVTQENIDDAIQQPDYVADDDSQKDDWSDFPDIDPSNITAEDIQKYLERETEKIGKMSFGEVFGGSHCGNDFLHKYRIWLQQNPINYSEEV
ncbi:MAG: hypothetical protein MAG795_00144 [Candidatus Woesearchaeota archaeon]|nr:hypothetical protein [Candidatus Woesearchaeota archaeon]